MSDTKKHKKTNEWFDDENHHHAKNDKKKKNKHHEKRLKRALKTLNIDELMEYEDEFEDFGDEY